MEGEFVEHDVPGVTARRVRIGRQADDARAVVGEEHFHGGVVGFLRFLVPRQDLEFLEGLAEVLDLFHEQARLPLAFGEDDVLGPPLRALEHGS